MTHRRKTEVSTKTAETDTCQMSIKIKIILKGTNHMINKVILMGRLTKDPELRYTNNKTPVCSFTIAVNNGYGEKQQTDFINCVAWNKTAEFVTKYFIKGRMIIIADGRISTRSWETQDGKRAYATEVVANEVNFGESKTSPQLNTPQTAAQPPMQDDDDDFTPLDEEDDDLPF